jgi:hypothetical protein
MFKDILVMCQVLHCQEILLQIILTWHFIKTSLNFFHCFNNSNSSSSSSSNNNNNNNNNFIKYYIKYINIKNYIKYYKII